MTESTHVAYPTVSAADLRSSQQLTSMVVDGECVLALYSPFAQELASGGHYLSEIEVLAANVFEMVFVPWGPDVDSKVLVPVVLSEQSDVANLVEAINGRWRVFYLEEPVTAADDAHVTGFFCCPATGAATDLMDEVSVHLGALSAPISH